MRNGAVAWRALKSELTGHQSRRRWGWLGAAALFVGLSMLLGVSLAQAASASVDLEQCHNGPATAPVDCVSAVWVNGNANSSHAHYAETYSVPYRAVMTAR